MSELPLITIGITCYNAEGTLERAVISALSQSWPRFEIVAVDDQSDDTTLVILQQLSNSHSCLRVISHANNKGVAAARNTIIDNAKGDFIVFFDDDDESLPERLEAQYKRIVEYENEARTQLVICHTARIQIFPDGNDRYEPTIGTDIYKPAPNSVAVADQILIGRPLREPVGSCATCSQMARKTLYQTINGFNESLRRNEDTDLNVRLAIASGHFVGIAEPLVKQYITASYDKNIEEERHNSLLWLDNNKGYLKKIGWYEHARWWLDIKFDYLAGRRSRFLWRMLIIILRYPVKTVTRFMWVWPNRYHSREKAEWYRVQWND